MNRRILVCNWRDRRNPDAGGAEVNIHAVFGRLVERGDHVTLLCSRRDASQPREEELDGIRVLRRGTNWTFNFTVPRVMLTELRGERFDLVVDEITKIPFYTPLYAGVPVLTRVHHVHGMSVLDDFGWLTTGYVVATESLVPTVYARSQFVAVSEGTKNDLMHLGVRGEQVAVIYNGLDHRLYHRPADARKPEPLVLYVGRLRRYKGAHDLLEAMARVAQQIPDVRCAIVGKGEEETALRAHATRLGLDARVEFLGYVDGPEKVALMQRARVLVNPSRKEGWGLTVLEANACGTVAIGAAGTGLSEAIQHGRTGFLYDANDVEALAQYMLRVLTDDALRQEAEREALAWAARFSWDRAVDEHEALIDRVLAGAPAQGAVTF